MIFFDGIHLMATDEAELHAKAREVGLKSRWFQPGDKHPHYDVWGKPGEKLMADADVQKVSTHEMLRQVRMGCLNMMKTSDQLRTK